MVISVLLYGCESWTYIEERFNVSVTEDYWASLGGTDVQTNQRKNRCMGDLAGVQKPLTQLRKNGKWNSSAMSQFRLANTIMHGWALGNRGRGRPCTEMLDNRHPWIDTEYTVPLQATRPAEKRDYDPASECVYGSWEIFGVKEEEEEISNNPSLKSRLICAMWVSGRG